MSFFVTITFDLKSALPKDYKRVKNRLDQIDLSIFLKGKKKETRLPFNTYTAKFDKLKFKKSTDVRNILIQEVKQIFNQCGLTGKYFIVVGQKWAWKIGQVR